MPGPFGGIDLASRALRNFQRALDVTGHNIANVNTPGYSRQAVDFRQGEPSFYASGRMWVGSGVEISNVNRIRDMFLEARRRDGESDLNRYRALAGHLDSIQGIFGEPSDRGISTALDKFWDAWSGLASNPADQGARMQVRLAGETLAARIRSTHAELRDLSTQIDQEINSTITEINSLAQQIHDLNGSIRHARAQGGMPNDLLDQRDQLVQRLSGLANITTAQFDDGSIAVYLSQHTLVEPASPPKGLPFLYDEGQAKIGNADVRSGKLRGLFDAKLKLDGGTVGSTTIEGAIGMLDRLANGLRTTVNGLHKTIADPLDVSERFFADVAPGNPQTGAIDFDLDARIYADHRNILAGNPSKPGDGSIALALSGLRSQSQLFLGSKSFNTYYQETITNLAHEVRFFQSKEDVQASIVDQIDAQQQAVAGVSLDDEMANMLRYQRSYQAAAKMLTIFDQVTEDLIGMIRR
jgi:flagellar hook-associated protein 1 FlgK